MNKGESNAETLAEDLDLTYGPIGSEKRDAFQRQYEFFKFGLKIKEARLKKGMTQEELAKKIGVHKTYISRIENNARSMSAHTLRKITQRLGGLLDLSITV